MKRIKTWNVSRKLLQLMALILCLCMLPWTALASDGPVVTIGATEDNVLFQDDFEGDTLNADWKIEGSGELKDFNGGKALYVKPSSNSWKARAMIESENPEEWTNYSIQMDFMKGETLTPGEDYTNPSWNPSGVYDNISIEGRIGKN